MEGDERQRLIARHDALVDAYNRLGDDITPEQNDAMLEELTVLELMLLGG
jgi:hypothetical protein